MATEVKRGTTYRTEGRYSIQGTGAVTPTNPRVDIIDPSGTVIVTDAVPTNDALGLWYYDYAVAAAAALGTWRAHWTGDIGGVEYADDDYFEVVESLVITAPTGICSVWTTAAAVQACCEDIGEEDLTDAIQIASDTLWALSGRRWAGECTTTIRPCGTVCGCESGVSYTAYGNGVWRGLGCTCDVPRVDLGYPNVQSITEVLIDGVALAASKYRLEESRWLIRMEDSTGVNPGWPTQQHLDRATTEEGTWSIEFVFGEDPPAGGQRAATVLACEIAKACIEDADCGLPDHLSAMTREGISQQFEVIGTFLAEGKTGLRDVDRWLNAVNPNKLARSGMILDAQAYAARHRRA